MRLKEVESLTQSLQIDKCQNCVSNPGPLVSIACCCTQRRHSMSTLLPDTYLALCTVPRCLITGLRCLTREASSYVQTCLAHQGCQWVSSGPGSRPRDVAVWLTLREGRQHLCVMMVEVMGFGNLFKYWQPYRDGMNFNFTLSWGKHQ